MLFRRVRNDLFCVVVACSIPKLAPPATQGFEMTKGRLLCKKENISNPKTQEVTHGKNYRAVCRSGQREHHWF